ncbi:hypothetical protein RB195_017378 [Necator americanus]|uniref:Uncharacterized protein n=1 Tax=Necator americanus TaxID=51031 RepID=A0ABR1C6W5_NECAM
MSNASNSFSAWETLPEDEPPLCIVVRRPVLPPRHYEANEVYPQDRPYIPVINEPPGHLGVRQFHRQAKSFDERGEPPRQNRRMSMDRRTLSEAERSAARQHTAQLLQPETPVVAACQSLWAAKGHLEELHALGISDPSSASTSFESNTDNSPASANPESKGREEGADKKRLQYNPPSRKVSVEIPAVTVSRHRYKETKSNQFRRRVEDESPALRSSRESVASRELRDLFNRRGSQQVDSRKTSGTSVLGDRRPSTRDSRRASLFSGDLQRETRDLRDFNRDRRRSSRNLFYDRDFDSRHSSIVRRRSGSRKQPQDLPNFFTRRESRNYRDRRNSNDVVYGVQSRRFSRELPEIPTFEISEATSRRNSRAYNDGRFPRDMSPLYERNENRERNRRRSSFIRHVAVSHDANFFGRDDLPDRDARSLFLRRKFLSTAAVSSLDSTNSTESSAPEAIFASSVDSAGSDLEHRRLSLMNRLPTGSAPHLMSRQAPSSANPPANTQRRRFRNRDYSVDAQSDSLFREWSRVDPAYEERDTRDHRDQREPRRRLERGASEDQSASRPVRARAYSRQLTVNPGGNVMVPFICYPDEVNCSR